MNSELTRLRRHFLPRHWDPTRAYSERKLDRVRAYKILAHAEIESFIETILLSVVDRAFLRWQSSKVPSSVLVCLMSATEVVKKEKESIDDVIERAVERYRTLINSNHGIKTRNLEKLLVPVGIDPLTLNQTWLNDMDSFGGRRGFMAHTSRIAMKTPPDPRTEKTAVDNLLMGLKDLDERVKKL